MRRRPTGTVGLYTLGEAEQRPLRQIPVDTSVLFDWRRPLMDHLMSAVAIVTATSTLDFQGPGVRADKGVKQAGEKEMRRGCLNIVCLSTVQAKIGIFGCHIYSKLPTMDSLKAQITDIIEGKIVRLCNDSTDDSNAHGLAFDRTLKGRSWWNSSSIIPSPSSP